MLKPVIKPITGFNYWLHRDELFSALPLDSASIVFAGDSHIENFEVSEIYNSLNIKNRGINYDTSAGLLNRLSDLIRNSPRKIFIEIGANDINNGISSDVTVHNISKMAEIIHKNSPNTEVFILGVISPNPTKTRVINSRIFSLSKAQSFIYVDLSVLFDKAGLQSSYDSGDGIHLNSHGYQVLSSVLAKHIF